MRNYAIACLALSLAGCAQKSYPVTCVGLPDIRLRPAVAETMSREELIAVARYREYYRQHCKRLK